MALEIERKWRIDPSQLPFDLQSAPHHRIVQSYVSFSPQIRLRSIDDTQFVMTVKKDPDVDMGDLVREEFEFAISPASYEHLMAKTEGRSINKTRYYVSQSLLDGTAKSETDSGGRIFEIDIYDGWLAGLAVAEMEFPSVREAEDFATPEWVLDDISRDPRFRNVRLAQIKEEIGKTAETL